ncbi:MAG: MFS transporter [Clostridiales bacterium]|nr:MFS transporter [Clostridiales bacterium]
MENAKPLVPAKTKLGYAAAALSDGTAYVFFYSFFLLFLTDYAMVDPLLAGSISLIVVICNAIMDPVVGWLSDNFNSKAGRRRPFFIIGIIPWVITLVLMFSVVGLSPGAQFGYYTIMAILFWASYSLCDTPYKALGAELSPDYSERATIRLYVQVFSSAGTGISGVFTMMLVAGFAMTFSVSEPGAWTYVASLFALISLAGYLVTFFSMKKWDKPLASRTDIEKSKDRNILKTYAQLLKEVKPLKWIVFSIFAFMVGNSLYGAGIFYMYRELLGWSPEQIAVAMLVLGVAALGGPVVLNFFIKKSDKKTVLCVCLAISTVSLFAFRFIGISTTAECYIYLFLYAASNIGFWGLIWAIVYDTSEVDELLHSKRREGATTAFGSMVQKFGSAFAMWLIGFSLAISGYDATLEAQPDTALTGILNTVTLYPGIFTLISLILLIVYPLNGKAYALVVQAIKDRKETGEFSREGLERII